jgi:23S rRNA (adenine2030-N6)-methyltransferase
MNYRHAFHAGNFADVIKHVVLTRILVHLCEKPQPFRVIDTHAGLGLYDLAGTEANRSGEWRAGIGRLIEATLAPEARALIAPYLDVVAELNSAKELRRYPGSPLLALRLMRAQDRLIGCELEPGAVAALAHNLRADRRAKAVAIDGFVALNAYVPPKERRGLVLIDPPFEARDEFTRVAKSLEDAHRKWATGIYVAWFPRKDLRSAQALVTRVERSNISKGLRVELDLADDAARLSGAGLLIINPPWRLEQELQVVLPELARALEQAAPPRLRIERLALPTGAQ